jgi:hypothetical protein
MQTTEDPALRLRREQAERSAADAEARRKNVELFTAMFLGLGADAMKLDDNRHDSELGGGAARCREQMASAGGARGPDRSGGTGPRSQAEEAATTA